MVINAAANRQKNVLMTITSLSGHAQLMVLVFLPRESVRDIPAILHQQRQPRSQSFSPAKSGNPGDKDLSKGGLEVLSRVFQNSILLLCRLHVCVKKRGAFKPSDEIKVVCDHSVIEISTSNYTYPTVVESTLCCF